VFYVLNNYVRFIFRREAKALTKLQQTNYFIRYVSITSIDELFISKLQQHSWSTIIFRWVEFDQVGTGILRAVINSIIRTMKRYGEII